MTFAKKARALAITLLICSVFTVAIWYLCFKFHVIPYLIGFYALTFLWILVEMKRSDRECPKQ